MCQCGGFRNPPGKPGPTHQADRFSNFMKGAIDSFNPFPGPFPKIPTAQKTLGSLSIKVALTKR